MLDIDPVWTILTLLMLLCFHLIVLKRYVVSILDPLVYFACTSSFALTLTAVYVANIYLVVRVFLYFLLFWMGFIFVTPSINKSKITPIRVKVDRAFYILIVAGAIVMVAINVYGWIISGAPLLSSDPSLKKVESLTGGMGFIRRFNWGIGNYILIGSILLFLYARDKISLTCFLAAIFVNILNGSKSALLPMLFALGLYILKPFLNFELQSSEEKIRRWIFPVLVMAMTPVVIVFVVQSEDLTTAAIGFVTRLLYFGDTMIFWGKDDLREYFSERSSPSDYPVHLLGSLFGMLRIIPYDIPFGNQFVTYTLSAAEEIASSSLGPNTPFYVKGELFFGVWFAPFYVFIVGGILAYFRQKLIKFRGGSLQKYTMLVTMVTFSMTLPTEDSLFVTRLIDFFMFWFLLYVITKLIDHGTKSV